MVKFRTNIYGYNKSDVASFVKEVASEYESIYEKLKNVTLEAENLRKENEKYKSLEKTLNDTLLLAQETSANAQKAAYAQSKLIVEDARNNASKIVNNSLIKAQNIEREAEEFQRNAISPKKRFIALVESQVDEMDKFDERL